MKFTITADALADAAGFAAKGISARPANPILSGLLIEAVPTGLRISGFDYEKSARTQVAAEVAEPGTVLLQGKMFTDIIRKFGKKAVTVAVDGNKAKLTSGSAVFTMHAMPVPEFPPMPDLPAIAGTVDGDAFAAAVSQIIGAAATDDSVAILMNVQLVTEGDLLTMRTTDRYRLAEVEIPWKSASADLQLILPAPWLQATVKTLAGEASILASESIVGIRSGNRATTTTVVDGDYPKIKTLFPDTTQTTITVDRAELADVIGRVALVAERNTPVRISTSKGTMTVEAGTGEDAQGQESITCEVDGEDVTVALNPGYLAWSLSVTPAAEIKLGVQGVKPMLITGHEGLRQLLMPVRL
ncbi:DNA polymerase III sliding clamp beta [Arthrobacter phage Zucker]|nr:DNA polymerase III sliding clamp beta [Arthrobacter phage Zucker]